MPFSIEIRDEEIQRRLNILGTRVTDLRPVFQKFGPYMVDQTRGYFRREESPDGVPWTPLSPSWKRRKVQEGRDNGIGRYRLSMLNGLTYDANGERLLVGLREPYAPAFQFGVPGQNQPARPVLGVTNADRKELSEIINDHLSD